MVPLRDAHLKPVALFEIVERLESDPEEGIRLAYYRASGLEIHRLYLVVLCRSGYDTSRLEVEKLVIAVERLEIEAVARCCGAGRHEARQT